jgi:hypothetical protein
VGVGKGFDKINYANFILKISGINRPRINNLCMTRLADLLAKSRVIDTLLSMCEPFSDAFSKNLKPESF